MHRETVESEAELFPQRPRVKFINNADIEESERNESGNKGDREVEPAAESRLEIKIGDDDCVGKRVVG